MVLQVAVIDDYQSAAAGYADWLSLLPRAEVTFFPDSLSDPCLLAERLRPFEVVVAMRERTKFDSDLLCRLPRLKLITTMGRRNAAIDLSAASRRGVMVSTTSSTDNSLNMASFTWALILGITRQIACQAQSVRQGDWQNGIGSEIQGKTLGILGLGRIGRQVARLGRAFGMNPIAWSENLTWEAAEDAGAELVQFEEIFARSDIVSIHLTLSDRTRGLVNGAAITKMKNSSFLINTARGAIVDEADLVAALRANAIAGAALDTFCIEPLPHDHPLRSLHNVLATPHIGFVTDSVYSNGYRQMLEAVRSFVHDEPVPRMLNNS